MINSVPPLHLAVGVLLFSTAGWAATPDVGNPYADTIVGRNVFSLKDPPPPQKPEDLIKKDPPPKILLQGLTTILGRRQVLFKVQVPAKPGQPAKEESFVSAEGERNGEIEVLEIDEVAGVVKFNNHGTIEPKNMKDDVAKATVVAPPPTGAPQLGVPPPTIPGLPRPTAAVNPASPGGSTVTTFGGGAERIPTRTLRTSNADGAMPGSFGAGQTAQANPASRPLSHEEQIAIMELQREHNKNNPKFPPLPPTLLTPPAPSPQ